MCRVDVDEEGHEEEKERGKEEEKEKGNGGGGNAAAHAAVSKNPPSSCLPPPPFSGVPVVVDATQTGGAGRFINHSCDPNCTTRAHADGGTAFLNEKTGTRTRISLRLPRVGVVARRDIAAGEELTYDYQFEPEPDEPAIERHCGARNCRGRLN